MHLVLSLILGFANAQAAIPLPKQGEAACYRRDYNSDHMRRNPSQALGSLYVWLRHAKDGSEEDYSGAKVLGLRRSGEVFLNRDPSCEFKADGTVFCFVECDGGSFSLEPRTDSIYFRVTKDYYFPLFRNGADPENPREEEILHLDGKDRNNNLYRLYQVDEQDCKDAFDRITERSYGC